MSKEIKRYRNKGCTTATQPSAKQQHNSLGTITLYKKQTNNKLVCDLVLTRACWVSWKAALIGTWLPVVLKSLLGKLRMISQLSSDLFSTAVLQAARASWADTLPMPCFAEVLLHEQDPPQPTRPQASTRRGWKYCSGSWRRNNHKSSNTEASRYSF